MSEDTLSSRRDKRHRLTSRESAECSSGRSFGVSNRAGIVATVSAVGLRMRMIVSVGLVVMEGLESAFLVAASLRTEKLGVLAVDIVKVHVHVGAGLTVGSRGGHELMASTVRRTDGYPVMMVLGGPAQAGRWRSHCAVVQDKIGMNNT